MKAIGCRPRPYNPWGHPDRTWLDIIIGVIFRWLILIWNRVKLGREPALVTCKKIRGIYQRFLDRAFREEIEKWSKIVECDIVECCLQVPRRPILEEWNLDPVGCTKAGSVVNCFESDTIPVYAFIPSTALSTQAILHATKSDKSGTCQLPVNTLDVGTIPLDIPLIIWFHGGGMTIGNAHDSEIIALVTKLTEISSISLHVAVCSIEFSLAPEHPFPIAVSEALTTVDYILSRCPDNRRIHLAGISAGANLAANCVSQFMTQYPSSHCIQSVLLLVPMLNPASDSMSCYLNSRQVVPASTKWLRWCWQQYLQLPPSEDNRSSNNHAMTVDELLADGSNRTTWNKSIWKNTSMETLVDPTVAIASGTLPFDATNSPNFITSTNKADSLHDAGVALYEVLKIAGAKVQHFDFPGSHWTGTRLDKASFQKLVQAWKEVILIDPD